MVLTFDFFLHLFVVSGSYPTTYSPAPSPFAASGPSQLSLSAPNIRHHSYHLSLVPGLGIAVTLLATIMLVLLIFLIRRKSKQLEEHDKKTDKTSEKAISQPTKTFQEGSQLSNLIIVLSL